MRWQWILGILVVVILALAVTAYILISHYDFNDLEPVFIQAVRNATGRELTLGGDIALHFGLTPSLVVEDVKFQNTSWGSRPDLARVKRLEVQVALLPLVTGNIRIRRFTAIKPAEKGMKTGEEKKPAQKKGFIEKTTDIISDTFKKLFGK